MHSSTRYDIMFYPPGYGPQPPFQKGLHQRDITTQGVAPKGHPEKESRLYTLIEARMIRGYSETKGNRICTTMGFRSTTQSPGVKDYTTQSTGVRDTVPTNTSDRAHSTFCPETPNSEPLLSCTIGSS